MTESTISPFTYRAFISYSHRDKTWADWLHRSLETYRVPSRLVGTTTAHGKIPRRLNPVFRDRDELSSSPELGTKINAALTQSENLIVICSPASATSRWANEEVLAYKRMDRAARIFCLIVGGEPNASDMPGRESEECFCPALRFAMGSDGRQSSERTEPIAADARADKDGKPNAKLKLIAGMLDIGFDTLKQREQRRQLQRMTAIAGIALVVMAVTIVLAIAALVSRHHAVIAQQAAQRRQKQAEGLVDFMLGNLSDKLTAESRLDVMQDVDDKAMAYFASLPPTDVNDTALVQRAKALEKVGYIRKTTGNDPGALQAFQASTAISSRLAAAQPSDVARQVAYSRTLAFVGMTYWDQGKLADAQKAFETALRVLQPSLKNAPDNLPLLAQMSYLENNLDHVFAARGQPDKAVAITRKELALEQRLVRAKPDDTGYASDLGSAHNELGRLSLQRGDLAEAIAEYRDDDAVETRLLAQHPNDNGAQEDMLETRAMLGRTLALAGDATTGMGDLRQSIDMAKRLAGFDASNTDYKDDLALYSSQLARLERQAGDLQAAKALTTQATALFAALIRTAPNNNGWLASYASALTEQAAESHAAGNIDAARAQAQAAVHFLEPMLAKHPDERRTLLATIAARLQLASVTSDPEAAQAMREQALQTMQAVKMDRGDPRLLALQVEVLLASSRIADAQPSVKQLWNEGYRDPEFMTLLQHARIDYPINVAVGQKIADTARTNSAVAPRSAAASASSITKPQ